MGVNVPISQATINLELTSKQTFKIKLQPREKYKQYSSDLPPPPQKKRRKEDRLLILPQDDTSVGGTQLMYDIVVLQNF